MAFALLVSHLLSEAYRRILDSAGREHVPIRAMLWIPAGTGYLFSLLINILFLDIHFAHESDEHQWAFLDLF